MFVFPLGNEEINFNMVLKLFDLLVFKVKVY